MKTPRSKRGKVLAMMKPGLPPGGAGLATLRAYVQALGGVLRVTADFGDEQLNLA